MICKFCGSKVEKGKICPNCGAMQHIEDPDENRDAPEKAAQSQGLYRDTNGAYHWEYVISTFSDRSVLIYLLRSVFCLGVFIAVVQLILWAGNGRQEDIAATLIFVAKCTAGLMAASSLLWVILMLIKGPRAIVSYTMNEKEISYVTEPLRKDRQGNVIRKITPVYTDREPTKWERPVSAYWRVDKIIAKPKKNLIRIHIFMQKSLIFVPQENYEFVYDFIASRCPNARIKGLIPSDNSEADNHPSR